MFSYDKTDRDDALPYVVCYPNGKAMLLLWTEDEAKLLVNLLNTFRESHPIDRPNDINQFIPSEENDHDHPSQDGTRTEGTDGEGGLHTNTLP